MADATPLQKYRESVPTVKKNCLHCGSEFETRFGLYCSSTCKSRHHRQKKREETQSKLVCYFCGGPITTKSFYKFCCPEHKAKFFKAKELGKPIKLRINGKSIVETKKYDSIPEVIKMYREQFNKKY